MSRFGLLGVLTLLVEGSGLCCSDGRWSELRPAGEEFHVDVPEEADAFTFEVGGGGAAVEVHQWHVYDTRIGNSYFVSYFVLSEAERQSGAQELLRDHRDVRLIGCTAGKIVRERDLLENGWSGLAFEGENGDGRSRVIRYVAGNRLYEAMVFEPRQRHLLSSYLAERDGSRFLRSFGLRPKAALYAARNWAGGSSLPRLIAIEPRESDPIGVVDPPKSTSTNGCSSVPGRFRWHGV